MIETQELRDLSDAPKSIILNGHPIQLAPPEPADFIEAIEFMRMSRQAKVIKGLAMVQDNELKSSTLAKVVCEPLGWADVILDFEGFLKITELMAKRGSGGRLVSNWEGFIKGLGERDMTTLRTTIYSMIPGILPPKEENGKAPLGCTESTANS